MKKIALITAIATGVSGALGLIQLFVSMSSLWEKRFLFVDFSYFDFALNCALALVYSVAMLSLCVFCAAVYKKL